MALSVVPLWRVHVLQDPTVDHDNTDAVLSLPLVPAAQRPVER